MCDWNLLVVGFGMMLAVPVAIHAAGELIRESMAADAQNAALEISEALKYPLYRNIDRIAAGEGPVDRNILQDTDLKELSSKGRSLMFPIPLAFGEHLRKIRLKQKSALSRQDLCDRDFMLCWLFLAERERYRDTRHVRTWMDFSTTMIRSWEDVMSLSAAAVQKKTKNRPMQNRMPVMQ